MYSDNEPTAQPGINEQDFIAASCAVIFAGTSVPSGDFRTHFKNISPGYCTFTVMAELRLPGGEWRPVDGSSKYPYSGLITWSLQAQQDFQGNLDIPARMFSSLMIDTPTPGKIIDTLNGAWLRISIVEHQRSITGMHHVYHHPPHHYHYSAEIFAWIPEPADLG